jgi:hypothetical protein
VSAIEGDVAPGFERVRDVFGDSFESNGDAGAALCVYRHGRKVVDLRGGLACVVSYIRQDLNDNRAALLIQAVRASLE